MYSLNYYLLGNGKAISEWKSPVQSQEWIDNSEKSNDQFER